MESTSASVLTTSRHRDSLRRLSRVAPGSNRSWVGTRSVPGGSRMTADGRVGAVVGLWRFPVKSMRGERLEAAELTDQGLLGDRTYALLDVETGKVASAKSVKLFPRLLDCT